MRVLEKLEVSDGMGAWIDDFKKSDAPQFQGKTDKERREMAMAAYLSAKTEAMTPVKTKGLNKDKSRPAYIGKMVKGPGYPHNTSATQGKRMGGGSSGKSTMYGESAELDEKNNDTYRYTFPSKKELPSKKEAARVDHQLKIAIDTVKNPNKSFLGGPSAKESEKTLRTKYKYTDKMIAKLKEDVTLDEATITYVVKGIQKPETEKFIRSAKLMKLKVSFKKDGNNTLVTMSGNKKELRDFDDVARGKSSYGDPSTKGGSHFDEESKGLWANIHAKRKRGEKPAKPGDKEYPKTLDIDEETISENYRVLAKHGMGAETKNSIKVGTEVDYYQADGAKYMGKITKMTPKGYIVRDDKTKKEHEFTYHDRNAAKKLLKMSEETVYVRKYNIKDGKLIEANVKPVIKNKKTLRDIRKQKIILTPSIKKDIDLMNLNQSEGKKGEAHHFTDLKTAQKKAREIGGKLLTGKGKSLGQFLVKKD
jgi:hypothetical protein